MQVNKPDIIHRWCDLQNYVDFTQDTIHRWIKLYGFPAPLLVAHSRNRAKGVYWSRTEVDAWMLANAEIVDKCKGHVGRFKIFDHDEILLAASRAGSAGEVAEKFGCSKKTVWNVIRKHKPKGVQENEKFSSPENP